MSPEADPAKLLGSVRFSARVYQDIRQLETPLVLSLDNYGHHRCNYRIFNSNTISMLSHLIHCQSSLFKNFFLTSPKLYPSEQMFNLERCFHY